MTAHTSRRLATMAMAVSLLVFQAQAQAKPGSDFVPAHGLGNWTYDYDVSGFKPGTYNILARATDSAGNITFATPFNIIVDPASDLPIVRIVNPLPMARVGADLNIVGTCIDDDAVGYVEIRLDGGEWQRARGTDFWSHYLPTSGIADGLHSLSVRGVDTNGLEGHESSVSFQLDRTKPLHTIASPSFGAIVSKRISIEGGVYDANGLAAVSYSTDSGSTWQALRYSYDKKAGTAAFKVAVDTTKLPDGPTVLWLRSVDRVGSESVAVFLYFVDNTKAELAVLSPGEGEAVNGRFSITGRVYDTVGVASLDWSRDKETGRVELLPGNPYFSIPMEAPAKAGPLTVRLNVTDVAGNVSALTVTRQVDPKADLPTIALSYPAAGATVDGNLIVAGGARDDDGVASVTWRIDNGPETEIVATGSFSFRVDALSSGVHTLWVRATDTNGLAGPWLQTLFTCAGKAPRVSLLRAVDASGERDFRPGVSISTMDGRASISGSIDAANPLVELSYTVNGGAAVKLPFGKAAGGASFTIPPFIVASLGRPRPVGTRGRFIRQAGRSTRSRPGRRLVQTSGRPAPRLRDGAGSGTGKSRGRLDLRCGTLVGELRYAIRRRNHRPAKARTRFDHCHAVVRWPRGPDRSLRRRRYRADERRGDDRARAQLHRGALRFQD